MTKSKLCLIFGAATLGITLVYSVYAQSTQSSAGRSVAPPSVALVDIVYLLSENASIDAQLAQINEKYSKAIQAVQQESEEIKKLRDQLAKYKPDSPKYREIEAQILGKASDMNAKQMLLVKQGTEERMRVIRTAYEMTREHAKRVADYLGMSIVLNYDRTPLPENIPGLLNSPQQYESYMVNYSQFIAAKAVIWARPGSVDITSHVLAQIQRADKSTIRPAVAAEGQPAATAGAVGAQGQPRR
ncbi:MAG: OmpH family outer membrane protein [Planctomycetia bacterium]|nr:OmpH family outer membrane protein [Planctomycetia bacterium]